MGETPGKVPEEYPPHRNLLLLQEPSTTFSVVEGVRVWAQSCVTHVL